MEVSSLNKLIDNHTLSTFFLIGNTSQRFASVCDIDSFKRDRFPENTLKKVKWILKTFYQWHNEWKTRLDGVNKVFKTLPEMSVNELNYCFQFFSQRLVRQMVKCILHEP
jgi:hypothetical protein